MTISGQVFHDIQGPGWLRIWNLDWPCPVGDLAMEEMQFLPEMLSEQRRRNQRRWRAGLVRAEFQRPGLFCKLLGGI